MKTHHLLFLHFSIPDPVRGRDEQDGICTGSGTRDAFTLRRNDPCGMLEQALHTNCSHHHSEIFVSLRHSCPKDFNTAIHRPFVKQ